MPDEIPMRREGNRLAPVDQMAEEMLSQIPTNADLLVAVHQPRNVGQFRLAWALAKKVSEAIDFLHDQADAMDWLLIQARHVRYIHDSYNNETQIIPKSIRWASLPQAGFERVFRRIQYIVLTRILPGVEESELRSEIEKMVGITPPESKPKRRRPAATKPQQEPAERLSREQSDATAGSITGGGDSSQREGGGNSPTFSSVDTEVLPVGDGNRSQAESLPKQTER